MFEILELRAIASAGGGGAIYCGAMGYPFLIEYCNEGKARDGGQSMFI